VNSDIWLRRTFDQSSHGVAALSTGLFLVSRTHALDPGVIVLKRIQATSSPAKFGTDAIMIYNLLARLWERLPAGARRYIEKRLYRNLVQGFRTEREPALAIALNMISERDAVVVVGANIGIGTVALARSASAGQWLSLRY
jgi:hypothetical protein